jgi:hypothetical protein
MTCPICNELMETNQRYPQMVCQTCLTLPITDQNGNRVEFHNIDFYGGFQSTHFIDNTPVFKTDHDCFIKGVACYAAEARFGGIVIQAKGQVR